MAPPYSSSSSHQTTRNASFRGTEPNTGPVSLGTSRDRRPLGPSVRLARDEYDNLLLVARQHANLRQNLLRGGVDEATLTVLSADDEANAEPERLQPLSPNAPHVDRRNTSGKGAAEARRWDAVPPCHPPSAPSYSDDTDDRRSSAGSSGAPFSRGPGFQDGLGLGDHSHSSTASNAASDALRDDGLDDGHEPLDVNGRPGQHEPSGASRLRPGYGRQCLRTLQLVGLPDSATLADVTAAVRGGLLLELYIRPQHRLCVVSFASELDAKAFFDHARRHDLYIKNKRVDIRWSERQFVLPDHLSRKINYGATRNLVLRSCHPRVTEASIREDLNHIFNLVLVSVRMSDGNCYISTNSVHNALFARSCMMSRMTYRASRIDWAPDECAQPLASVVPRVVPATQPKKAQAVPKKKPGFGVPNRFQLLNLDDDGNDKNMDNTTDEDEDAASSEGQGEGGVLP